MLNEFKRCANPLTGFEYYAGKYQRIFDMNKNLVPFKFNEAQRILHEKWNEQVAQNKPVRIVNVKPKKYPGMSTYCLCRGHWRLKFEYGFKSFHYIHAAKLKYEFSEKVKVAGDNLPDNFKTNGEEYLTERSKSPATYGTMVYDTASKGATVPRGMDPQLIHISEYDFINDDGEFLKAALLAMSDEPGTELIVESTAYVFKGALFNLYFGAVEGRNNFTPVLIRWFDLPTLRKTPPAEPPFSEREELLITEHKLDLEQIAWRRWMIRSLDTTGDPEEAEQAFMREFPEDELTPFMSGKKGVFSRKTIERHMRGIKKDNILPQTIPGIEGNIYWKPEEGKKYIIGVDVSEGPESKDCDAAVVWDIKEGTQCFVLYGNYDLDIFADHLYKLGIYYNNAFLAVERNNHGIYINGILRNMGYPNLYYEGKGSGSEISKWGFLTTGPKKVLMIDQLKRALNKDEIIPYDEGFLRDCLYLKDLVQHTPDRIMAGAIGVHLMPKAVSSFRMIGG